MTRPARARASAWRWLGRAALGLGAIVAASVAGGSTYQAVASVRDSADYPPPGRLVDVGGYRLHLYCTGVAAPGQATVILISGSDSPSPAWARIQGEVAAKARVCSYDRAGTGWSDASTAPRDPAGIARELALLLNKADIPFPYLLVGHSSGGLYARAFQRLYPASVSGMVLLDATHEDYFTKTPEGQAEHRQLLKTYALVPTLARLGVMRANPVCSLPADFPARARDEFHALCSEARPWPAEAAEMQALTAPLPPQAAALAPVPLTVVSAGANVRSVKHWAELQDALATSPGALHIVVDRATHSSLLTDAQDAHTSSLAVIQQLVPPSSSPASVANGAHARSIFVP